MLGEGIFAQKLKQPSERLESLVIYDENILRALGFLN